MKTPVAAIVDVGKTNKKLLLFDRQYRVVSEQSTYLPETIDEDGDPCEDLDHLRRWMLESLRGVFRNDDVDVKAINVAAYGASLVYVDKWGTPLAPLYNYLKPYPQALQKQFYARYGGEDRFAFQTASPVLGSLNSGMQLYRIKYERPELFARIHRALHLPQYLSFLVSGEMRSDMTSIGCHTNLWDFTRNDYHPWVEEEGLLPKFAPIAAGDKVFPAKDWGEGCHVGIGLHDSSAALIPYQTSMDEPFVLTSTGTWCISLNPFNHTPLTANELKADCLSYISHRGTPVKASRLFAGHEHEQQVRRIAEHFGRPADRYREMAYDGLIVRRLRNSQPQIPAAEGKVSAFGSRDLASFADDTEAYHQLMMDLVASQKRSTDLILSDGQVKRILVDGGFNRNDLFMNLLAESYPDKQVCAASMAQATAVGAAMAIHSAWNPEPPPPHLVKLKRYPHGWSI